METFKKDKQRADFTGAVISGGAATLYEMNMLKRAGLPMSYVTDGFFVRHDDMTVKIQYGDIVWVEAGGNYSHIHCRDKSRITVVHNLGRLEEMLPQRYFTRINKSEIVNLHLVDRFCGNLIYINKRAYTVAANCREYVFSCFSVLLRKR